MTPQQRIVALESALTAVADDLEGLLPYLAMHHYKVDDYWGNVKRARELIGLPASAK